MRAILTNPRYTGKQVWNRQRKDEVLLDVTNVAQGHVTELRWKPTSQTRKRTSRTYVLRGLLFCAACDRRMGSHWVNHAPYYRCRFPQEYAFANKVSHPLNVSIREDRIAPRLDRWLATVFEPDAVERTLDSLTSALRQLDRHDGLAAALRREIAEADRKLARHRAALEADADRSSWPDG